MPFFRIEWNWITTLLFCSPYILYMYLMRRDYRQPTQPFTTNEDPRQFRREAKCLSKSNNANKLVCEICESSHAESYCMQCKQCMCTSCHRYHGKFFASRYHTIVTREAFNSYHEWNNNNDNYTRLLALDYTDTASDCCCQYIDSNHSRNCNTGTIFIGAVNTLHDFYFVKRKFSVVDYTQTECIVFQNRQQKMEMAHKKSDAYRSSLQTTCISDIHLHKLWISTGDNRIYQLDVKTNTLATAFMTEGACHGLALFDGGFAVIVLSKKDFDFSKWQIKLLTRCGVFKGELVDKKEKNMLKTPNNLHSNANEDILYVSDGGTNSVSAINSRGCILFVFTSTSMFAPGCLAVDLEGNIYVSCDQGVLQIHKDGKESRLVLKLKDNKPGVQSVFFDRKRNCLVVLKDSKSASVFRFVDCLKKVSNASDFNIQL